MPQKLSSPRRASIDLIVAIICLLRTSTMTPSMPSPAHIATKVRLSSGRFGKPEAHVAEAARRAHRQPLLDELERVHADLRGARVGGDGEHQWVDPEVLGRQAGTGAEVVQLLGDGEAVLGRRRDAGVAQAQADDRALVLLARAAARRRCAAARR